MASTLEMILPLFDTPTLPGLGPERRAEARGLAEIKGDLGAALAATGLAGLTADKVRSAALLWHDHLDASHEVSQDLRDSDGSFLHGLMHRREPDEPSEKDWLNRTGAHSNAPEVAKRAGKVLAGSSLKRLADGGWDTFAMVDAVAEAREGSEDYRLLQEVQRVELEVLLERFCG